MYIALYGADRRHLTNLENVTYELTERVWDADSFSAEGRTADATEGACVAVLNDESGKRVYACLVDSIKPEGGVLKLRGKDFRTLWDTDILLDFTASEMQLRELIFLSNIFKRVAGTVFGGDDGTVTVIPVGTTVGNDMTDTSADFGLSTGTYLIVNAYEYLLKYLKFYEYRIESGYDIQKGEILFSFVKRHGTVQIDLDDFSHTQSGTTGTVNRAVATIKYDVQTPQLDEDGNPVYVTKPVMREDGIREEPVQMTDESGAPVVDEEGNPVYLPAYQPRPDNLAAVYYYRDRDNNIISTDDARGDFAGRIYPVHTKYFEAETLPEAQLEAAYELANARYQETVVIDSPPGGTPIDLTAYPLYTMVELWREGRLYKTLPIGERSRTARSGESTASVKLGFQKTLLTEIIKR